MKILDFKCPTCGTPEGRACFNEPALPWRDPRPIYLDYYHTARVDAAFDALAKMQVPPT